ncbi:hypothetical protein [Stutzerimonas stutzeri]|uniref:hypothetical protein n=1 Tax=Stutzerimonas stutzeri TaxID=316 RepID=UPI000F7903F5|nr:hypothetical protein [Stutzerimonas stutzeri]MDH0427952.1 hypothetical protein [Stutzerimonas stutzeri]
MKTSIKWLLYAFALAFFCTACDTKNSTSSTASTVKTPESPPGATSIAGITPGKTTLEDLKNLVVNPSTVDSSNYHIVELKELNNGMAFIKSKDSTVYKVELPVSYNPEIVVALIEKYGAPKIKNGGINEVTCQNGLGASFQRLEGMEDLLWKPNAGTQAYLHKWAKDCGEEVNQTYIIEHIETVKALDLAERAERVKVMSNKVDKAKAGL